jgi:signal peptidase I
MYKIVMLSAGLLLGLILARLFFFVMKVETGSMNPNLREGDRILVSRLASVGKGDIVAVESPVDQGKLILSRIIAQEFETVEIRNRVVYINDTVADFRWNTLKEGGTIYPMKFTFRDNMPLLNSAKTNFSCLGTTLTQAMTAGFSGWCRRNSLKGYHL